MAGLQTATDLQSAVAAYAKRSDTATMYPVWLALAETRIAQDLRTSEMIKRVNPYVVSQEFQPVPVDFLAIRRIRLLDQPSWDLEFLQPDQMARRVQETSGITNSYLNAYSMEDSNFWFSPVPAQNWNCELSYYAQIPSLSSNSTNWLLTNYADVYLFAMMTEVADFQEDDDALEKYQTRLKNAIDGANLFNRKRAQASNISPQPARPQVF